MIDVGIDSIEIDILYTKDRYIIVYHGSNFGYVHAPIPERDIHEGMKPNECHLEDLLLLDIGEEQRIPTLEQTLLLCKGKIKVNIEVKELDLEIVSDVINMVDKLDMYDECQVSGFHHHII
jgi:glycerophosphoryl diester phosphodiesterase